MNLFRNVYHVYADLTQFPWYFIFQIACYETKFLTNDKFILQLNLMTNVANVPQNHITT